MSQKKSTPRSYGLGRTEQIQVRVTPDEARKLRTVAESRGFSSVSDFARYLFLQEMPDLDALEQELNELSDLEVRVQNLANQIRARHGMGGKRVQ